MELNAAQPRRGRLHALPLTPLVLFTALCPTSPLRSKVIRVHAAVAGRHTRHGQLLPLEVYLEEGIPLVGGG